jgi:hypothetical protein
MMFTILLAASFFLHAWSVRFFARHNRAVSLFFLSWAAESSRGGPMTILTKKNANYNKID